MGTKLTDMDMDTTPPSQSAPTSSLKRCSSAPMINELNAKMTTTSSTSLITPNNSNSSRGCHSPLSMITPRARRFSASFSPHSSPGPRLTPRVSQLRQEEAVDVTNIREVAHEREIHSAMQMSQSWEDLTLTDDNDSSSSNSKLQRMLPLNITLPSNSVCSSPSPTRGLLSTNGAANIFPPRQCFSPSLQMAWKMSPSPTRKSFTTRRSLSPIAMRPSSLGPVKRKFELDDEKSDYNTPPIKRHSNSNNGNSLAGGGLLMAHHHHQNSHTPSPLPGSLSSVGTPESLSSADSPGFTFHPVDDSPPQTTNSNDATRLLNRIDEPMNEETKSINTHQST